MFKILYCSPLNLRESRYEKLLKLNTERGTGKAIYFIQGVSEKGVKQYTCSCDPKVNPHERISRVTLSSTLWWKHTAELLTNQYLICRHLLWFLM